MPPYLTPDLLLIRHVTEDGGSSVDRQGTAAGHDLNAPVRLPVDAQQTGEVPVGKRRPERPQFGGPPDDPAVGRRVVLVPHLKFARCVIERLVDGLASTEKAKDIRAAQPELVVLPVEHAQPDHFLQVPAELFARQLGTGEPGLPVEFAELVQVLGRERLAGIRIQAARGHDESDDPVPGIEIDRPPEPLDDQVSDFPLGDDPSTSAASITIRPPPDGSSLRDISRTRASQRICTRLAW